MNEYKVTKSELERAKKIVAAANGSKGGRTWWYSLTKEQQRERIDKIQAARKQKREVEKQSVDKSSS